MFTVVHMLIFAALRGLIMFDKIPMFKRSIPGKEMHFHACTYWKPFVLEREGIMKSVPCSIDMSCFLREHNVSHVCISLDVHGKPFVHICMYMSFKYRRIAQVSAVAFTLDFPNEWTQIIPRIPGMLQIWPWNAVTFPKCWGLVALDSVLGKPQWWYHGDTMWSCRVIRGEPGEVWLSMEVTQHLLNSGTWGLYLCMLWLQVRSRSQSA